MAKVTAPNNMDIWNALGKTDPAHTKPFTRSGGFKGTAIKPMWANLKMTEYFGPCGVKWGMDKPEFQLVPVDGEILVYCTVMLWYHTPMDARGNVFGIGGDKVVARGKDGFRTDDEAFKKAYTDALSNAMKFIGVAADVHMGQFDDNKYVRQVAAEFEDAKKAEVIAEVERQKRPFIPNELPGAALVSKGPTLDVPPELDWSYNRSSGVLICRVMEAKVGKIKTGNNAGKEYVILTVNNELDKGKKPDLFYWHATHREALLAAKGKVVKLLILAKEKGFTVDAVMEIDGKKLGLDEASQLDNELLASKLASDIGLPDEELREMHYRFKGDWAMIIERLQSEKLRRENEVPA